MGLFDGVLRKAADKSTEKWEREFEDKNERLRRFESEKEYMLGIYESGSGIDDSDECKGDINKCYKMAAILIPSSYRDEFQQYVLQDSKVKEIINKSSPKQSNTSTNNSSSKANKIKEQINEWRNEDDDYGFFICNMVMMLGNYDKEEEKDIVWANLSDKEKKDVKDFLKEKNALLEHYDEDDSCSFINYLKEWYTSTTFKLAYDLLIDLASSDYISDDDKDEIENYKSENDSFPKQIDNKTKKSSDSLDIDDIKSKLEKLKMLQEEGLISNEDFEKKKSDLLASI